MAQSPHLAKEPEKGLWKDYLQRYWEGGRKKVQNPDWHTGDPDGRKDIEMSTRIKKDRAYRNQIQENFRAWKDHSQADVEDKVSDFFEQQGNHLPDNTLAAIQFMQLHGVITREDLKHQDHIVGLVEDQLDLLVKQDEEKEKKRPFWDLWRSASQRKAMSQRVARRWLLRLGRRRGGPYSFRDWMEERHPTVPNPNKDGEPTIQWHTLRDYAFPGYNPSFRHTKYEDAARRMLEEFEREYAEVLRQQHAEHLPRTDEDRFFRWQERTEKDDKPDLPEEWKPKSDIVDHVEEELHYFQNSEELNKLFRDLDEKISEETFHGLTAGGSMVPEKNTSEMSKQEREEAKLVHGRDIIAETFMRKILSNEESGALDMAHEGLRDMVRDKRDSHPRDLVFKKRAKELLRILHSLGVEDAGGVLTRKPKREDGEPGPLERAVIKAMAFTQSYMQRAGLDEVPAIQEKAPKWNRRDPKELYYGSSLAILAGSPRWREDYEPITIPANRAFMLLTSPRSGLVPGAPPSAKES